MSFVIGAVGRAGLAGIRPRSTSALNQFIKNIPDLRAKVILRQSGSSSHNSHAKSEEVSNKSKITENGVGSQQSRDTLVNSTETDEFSQLHPDWQALERRLLMRRPKPKGANGAIEGRGIRRPSAWDGENV